MDKQQHQQSIESYLRNELSAADRERLEQSIATDPTLAVDVLLHQLLQEEFGDREKQAFIKALQAAAGNYFDGQTAVPVPAKKKRRASHRGAGRSSGSSQKSLP